MEKKVTLVDLGNISEPAAGVVNNFIDKISSALEWMVTPKGINSAEIEANKSIIKEIADRKDINPIERAALVSSFKKTVKEYINQADIMQRAVAHLEPDFRPEEVNNGWIAFFFDKVKDVSEDYMKEIWSKLLAGEFNEPGTYTKQFLNLMSLMDSNIAKRFQKIRSSCFYAEPFLYSIIYRNNGGNINNIKRYEKMGIFIKDFRELENFGLIQYKFASFHTWQIKNRTFCYGDKRIRLDTNKKLTALGNVALTDAGKQLCRIVPMEYDGRMLEICLEAWEELGYNPVLEFMEE